jgi:hypothetical protein
LAEEIGADGRDLLDKVYTSATHSWLQEIPAIGILRSIWIQQYHASEQGTPWRQDQELPPSAQLIQSPLLALPNICDNKQQTTVNSHKYWATLLTNIWLNHTYHHTYWAKAYLFSCTSFSLHIARRGVLEKEIVDRNYFS